MASRPFVAVSLSSGRLVPAAAGLFALLVFLALSASPAFAERARVFEGAFGCAAGAEGCTVPDPYPLHAQPWSVAVNDTTGDVYVADGLNHRVEEFTAKGEFVLMFGQEVNRTKVLDGFPSEAGVCTEEEVRLGAECQDGVASPAPGAFESIENNGLGGPTPSGIMFVAVDNSSGESAGDVYVADYVEGAVEHQTSARNRVSKFDSSGHLVSTWGEAGEILRGGAKSPFGEIMGIAVDASGDLWVGGFEKKTTFEFDQEAKLKTEWPTPVATLPSGVAVDSQDDVYFAATLKVSEVTSAGVVVGRISEELHEQNLAAGGAAVDSLTSELYLLNQPAGGAVQLQRYLPGCRPLSNPEGPACIAAESFTSPHLTQEFDEAHGLAVNPFESNTVYVSSRARGEVQFYSVVTVPAVHSLGPSAVSAGLATLNGTVNPSGESVKECFFEYGETTAYGHRAQCEGEVPADSRDHAVHAKIEVEPGKTYHYRLVAFNANDEQEPEQSADVALGPPLLSGESSVEVGSRTATVQALVDPQSVDTRVRVEYGTSTEYGKMTGELDVGAGAVAQAVPVAAEGLSPSTTYHYRFVAENALGEGAAAVVGPDRVFSTQGAGAFRLPDGRSWELVSGRDRHGAAIEPLAGSYAAGDEIQASAAGGAISYLTNNPLEGVAGFPEFAQVLSTRGPSGWVSHDLSVPHSGTLATGSAVTAGREYRYFSEDLSKAGVQPQGPFEPCTSALGAAQPCVSPETSEQTALVQDLDTGVFTPLVTGCPSLAEEEEGHACPAAVAEHADVPAGTVFGQVSVENQSGLSACPPEPYCGPFFEDATPDFSHVVVDSPVSLSEEPGATKGLYEWSAGSLRFVGEGSLGAGGNQDSTDDRHAISDDGSRVFFTQTGTHDLFMRDMVSGELLEVDAPEAECLHKGQCAPGGGEFQFASANGERVFFTDGARLTQGAGTSDLYECRILDTAGKLSCDLRDLTPPNGGESAGTPPAAQGIAVGASEDGSYVYFVANGVQGDGSHHGAAPGNCHVEEASAPGQHCNLYVSHEGTTKLIAVLSGMDAPDWGAINQQYGATARVSPSGQWLAFMSNRSLTGYDNRDASSGEPDEEVYLYDAATEHLTCASCEPTGARPDGVKYGTLNEPGEGPFLEGDSLVGSFKVWYSTAWLAANIPSWTFQSYHNAVYQSRYLSDEGRLFFNTLDGLVPKDTNSQQDVYEYEPEGVGPAAARCEPSAASGSEVYKPQHEYKTEEGQSGTEGAGCVALISSGTSGEESAFMDASETGGDVFFITSAHLVPGSIENGTSLYDAHECTTSSPCPTETEAPPSCTTAEGCRAAPEPQPSIYGPPSSATFKGPGNPTPGSALQGETGKPPPPPAKGKTAAQIGAEKLKRALKACKEDKSKTKRSKCEKAAHKAYAAKASAKKSQATSRRGG